MAYREWAYTPEQAALIKAGDMDARNRFYEDNLDIIRGNAFGYVAKMRVMRIPFACEAADLVQQVWLDLPFFDYQYPRNLSADVRLSFYMAAWGGWSYLAETHSKYQNGTYRVSPLLLVDEPIKGGDGQSLVDSLCFVQSAEGAYFAGGSEECAILLKLVLSRFFSPRQMQVLGLYIDGYRMDGIAAKTGIGRQNVSHYLGYARANFVKRYDEIIAVLQGVGFCVSVLSALGMPRVKVRKSRV
jgi:DNA-directed RNA polymerase specialized sigma24 family protein